MEHADHVLTFLKRVQESSTQEILHELACEMETSDVWISNEKLQQWFHLEWLANAKVRIHSQLHNVCSPDVNGNSRIWQYLKKIVRLH